MHDPSLCLLSFTNNVNDKTLNAIINIFAVIVQHIKSQQHRSISSLCSCAARHQGLGKVVAETVVQMLSHRPQSLPSPLFPDRMSKNLYNQSIIKYVIKVQTGLIIADVHLVAFGALIL